MSTIRNPAMPAQRSGDGGWAVAIFLFTFVPSIIFNGWVLSVIWNWFMPVIFPALHPLTIVQALGLSLVISVFAGRSSTNKTEGESAVRVILGLLGRTLLRGGFLLLMGFIYHLFL